MVKRYTTPTLVMNIKRPFFAAILADPPRKRIEYRSLSSYWLNRLEKVEKGPFNLRLLNGMSPPVPEATLRIKKVVKNHQTGELEFHLGEIIEVINWDRCRELPRT